MDLGTFKVNLMRKKFTINCHHHVLSVPKVSFDSKKSFMSFSAYHKYPSKGPETDNITLTAKSFGQGLRGNFIFNTSNFNSF